MRKGCWHVVAGVVRIRSDPQGQHLRANVGIDQRAIRCNTQHDLGSRHPRSAEITIEEIFFRSAEDRRSAFLRNAFKRLALRLIRHSAYHRVSAYNAAAAL